MAGAAVGKSRQTTWRPTNRGRLNGTHAASGVELGAEAHGSHAAGSRARIRRPELDGKKSRRRARRDSRQFALGRAENEIAENLLNGVGKPLLSQRLKQNQRDAVREIQ